MNAVEEISTYVAASECTSIVVNAEVDGDLLNDLHRLPLDFGLIKLEEDSLLQSMGIAQRKRQGVFFTPEQLAKLAVSKIDLCPEGGSVLDPACGTGNLLLEVASRLDVVGSLRECLDAWNKKIHGLDINASFIRLAQKKIVCLAVSKGALPSDGITLAEAISLLSNIRVGDFLVDHHDYKGLIQHVVMNPPFCPIETPGDIKWTSGKSNAAASFMAYAVDILPVGGNIVGILPDVLKSGSRYEAWRREVFDPINPEVEDFGIFQKDVQIDVFILLGTKKSRDISSHLGACRAEHDTCLTLSDKFSVSVGPVVPHRDEKVGSEAPYAHAKILPAWSTVNVLPERIVHAGRKISCPFVAIRRTSSPKDKHRVVGTIVNCDESVAVENHIIVVCPNDGSIEACVKLLEFFKSSAVNDYINSRTRCRHLTVGLIKDLPVGGMDEHKE